VSRKFNAGGRSLGGGGGGKKVWPRRGAGRSRIGRLRHLYLGTLHQAMGKPNSKPASSDISTYILRRSAHRAPIACGRCVAVLPLTTRDSLSLRITSLGDKVGPAGRIDHIMAWSIISPRGRGPTSYAVGQSRQGGGTRSERALREGGTSGSVGHMRIAANQCGDLLRSKKMRVANSGPHGHESVDHGSTVTCN